MARRRRPPRPGALTELPPLKILSQILLLQAIWYTAGTALILFTALVAGKKFTFDMVLSWRSLRGDTTVGWMFGFVWMINSIVGVISLLLLISRSKLIPDFALTLHLIHLVLVSWYSRSIPRNALWWLLNIASAALMVFLGMWACQWRELRPITFGGASIAGATRVAVEGMGGPDVVERAEEGGELDGLAGYGRRGRGRGRDGAGEYEMVGMSGSAEASSSKETTGI